MLPLLQCHKHKGQGKTEVMLDRIFTESQVCNQILLWEQPLHVLVDCTVLALPKHAA